MTTSKNYGPRRDGRVGIVGIESGGPFYYWNSSTFALNIEQAIRLAYGDHIVATRQRMLDARKTMDAAERETFIVDYDGNWSSVTDIEGRVFGINASDLTLRPTDTPLQEARNYLIQEILDALKVDQELTFAWVTVRTPKPTPKPVVEVADGQYNVTLPGDLRFAIDVDKAHLLPQVHDAIEAHTDGEAKVLERAMALYRDHGTSEASWGMQSRDVREGWLYAARLGER